MPVAQLILEIAIEHAQSIKDRRQVVRALKDRLRHDFNVSVAELDDATIWNRATIGIASISSSCNYVLGQLAEVEKAAYRHCVGLGAEITDAAITQMEDELTDD